MTWQLLALVLLVLVSSAAIDYAHARYALARDAGRPHRASCWSVGQWMAATVGFLVAIKVSIWLLPFEAAGLYIGTWIAVSPSPLTRQLRSRDAPRALRRAPGTPAGAGTA